MKLQYSHQMQYGFGDDLLSQIGGGLAGGIGGALTGGIKELAGLALQPLANQQQLSQQEKLTQMQLQANEQLSAYNMQQQYQYWNETNYPAQVQQLEKAGLNPALLYAKGGTGGSTASPTTGIGMGIAPGMNPGTIAATNQAGAQQTADVRLKNAEAANIEAQTPQQADLMKTQIASLTQGIQNSQAQQVLTQLQQITQNIQNEIQGKTAEDQIASIRAAATQVESQAQQAVRNNFIDQKTMNDKIATIHGIMLGQFIQNNLQTAQTNLTSEQQTQITNKIVQDWRQLEINGQNSNTNEKNMQIQQFINDMPKSMSVPLETIGHLLKTFIQIK